MSDTINDRKINILLVEDSEVHAAMIRDALASTPMQVHLSRVESLEEARASLAESVPDLILVDFLLPDGKGIDLLPGNQSESACPMIMVTSRGDEQLAVEALKAGALDYVVKTSEALAGLPHVIERTLREWDHIVQRKEAEKGLRESEERFRSVFETAAAGMVILSLEHKIIRANSAFCSFTGYDEDELLDLSIEDVTHPEDRERTSKSYRRLISGQSRALHYEKRYLRKDGKIVWGQASVACLISAGYCIGLVQDITPQKEAEEALQAAYRYLEDVIDFLPDATFVIDRNKKVVAWNRAMEEMTGVAKEKVIGQGDDAYALAFYGYRRPLLVDLLDETDPEAETTYDLVERENLSIYAEGFVPSLRQGKGAYIWGKATRLFDRAGNCVGAIESLRDISERKVARDKLETANRELEAFVYTVSHDLRNPLSPIIGYADFLHENCHDKLNDQELLCLAEISNSGKRMVELMEDLLVLARVGQVERPAVPLNMEQVANEVIGGLAGQIIQAGVSVNVSAMPALRVPRSLQVLVFDNLIGNALRYGCKPGDVIEVGGERRGDKVRIYVRDHGPGVPAEERSRIFEVFYRGTTGKNQKGTGIGLATIQKIARLFEGEAWVEETTGGGSTFLVEVVDLPFCDPS